MIPRNFEQESYENVDKLKMRSLISKGEVEIELDDTESKFFKYLVV
jgi:hypothetical protein